MHLNQDPTNLAAKNASSGELSRWRDEGVDPALLRPAAFMTKPEHSENTHRSVGNFTLAAAVASEMPVNGVQRSFEAGYTGVV